jgi:hypothetical protein
MGVPSSAVGYTSATTGRGDHEVHQGHAVAVRGKKLRGFKIDSVVTETINYEYNPLTPTTLLATLIVQFEARTVSAASMMESGVRCPLGESM